MTGTVVRIGRYRSSSGPDLATVGTNQQVATFTNPDSNGSRIILYRGGAWVGRYSGNPIARLGLHWWASDSASPNNRRPGGVARYTGELSPSVAYTGAGEGQQMFANLTEPYLTDANYEYTVSATNRSGILGIAMFQAASISEPNEWFYRKNISGNIPVDGAGSSSSNEGQLCVWFEGEVNVAPGAPTSLSPSGSNLSITRTPTLLGTFNDANITLNNGVAWDRLTSTEVEVRLNNVSGAVVYSRTWNNSASEQSAKRSSTVSSQLNYDQTYYYRVRHKDRAGLWGAWAATTFSIKDPNDPPLAPDGMTPSGNLVASNTVPSFRFRHRDPNGHSANRAHIQVQTTGGSSRWDFEWAVTVGNNNYATRSYAGTALAFETAYRWRVRTRDTGGYWGAWSGWVNFTIYKDNTAPYAPDQLSPSGSITGGLEPLLSMRHRDPDGNSTNQVSMQVRQKGGSIKLDTTWTVSIAHNGKANRVYDGLTLAYNTDYEFRGRTQDSQGAWGAWSSWVTFQITSLSSVAQPSSPSGYQPSQIPDNVVARYTHNSGVSSEAFRVQLQTDTGTAMATSGWISKTVASGSDVTITWAETGIGGRAWGAHHQIVVQARDANGVVSPSWSPARKFNINAAPSTPSGLSPNGNAYATRPLLTVINCSDPDSVHPKSSLILRVEIMQGGVVLQTRTMTWNAASNRWQYQTTSADLPAYGTFQWRAYAGDGIVWSGGSSTEAGASRSGIATFVYDQVPTVTVTGPASPIETSLPTITWSVDLNQASWAVRLYNDDDVKVYEASGTGSSTSHTMTLSGWIGGEVWNTGETFYAEIDSTSTSSLKGTSERVAILLEYTPPESLPLDGEAVALPQTSQPNAFSIWHNPTPMPSERFEGYIWRRTEIDEAGYDVPGTEVQLTIIMNAGVTGILDASVVSGVRYRWSLVARERRDNDIVLSDPTYFEGVVEWGGIVVHAPHDPMKTAIELIWSGPDADYDPSYHWSRSSQQFEAVSGERIFSIGKKMHKDSSGTFEIMDDEYATAEQRLATLDYLYRLQGGEIDGEPHIACWRTGRGGVNGIIYGVLRMDPDITYDQGGWYVIDIGIQSASYQFGVQEEGD